MAESKTVDKNRGQAVDVKGLKVSNDSEAKRKTSAQDRTVLKNTDHVQYHLDVDPNDPRNRDYDNAAELKSLDD